MAKSTKTDVDLKALLVEALVRDLTPTWGKSSHPDIPIYLGAMHNVMFVMGWSLKMRHACDFMVIEHIGSLMNMSYWNLISWRHDMALFCFRHGLLQMREGVKVPNPTSGWTQSTRSRRRREFRLGGLAQCWPWGTLVKACSARVILSAIFVRNCWKSAWKWKIRACPTTCHLWDTPTV